MTSLPALQHPLTGPAPSFHRGVTPPCFVTWPADSSPAQCLAVHVHCVTALAQVLQAARVPGGWARGRSGSAAGQRPWARAGTAHGGGGRRRVGRGSPTSGAPDSVPLADFPFRFPAPPTDDSARQPAAGRLSPQVNPAIPPSPGVPRPGQPGAPLARRFSRPVPEVRGRVPRPPFVAGGLVGREPTRD